MKKTPSQTGRPRNDELNTQIKQAAWELLAQRPLAELTINEIAARAETTRPAVYRRWSRVEDIVIDAFLDAVSESVPSPKASEPSEQLHEYILLLCNFVNSWAGRVIAEILGRAQSDPQLMTKFQEVFLMPRRGHASEIIKRGQDSGCFRTDLEMDFIIDLYAGPIYFRAFSHHAELDQSFAEQLADVVLKTLRK
ncbi:hypothetical protein CS022_14090 [Veronia nyctiphanis]|uniref:HTH tetR-type domain-containing protein n=1 Tax=Veronia nyctiphanis TaxID=1278244 RepID=A0A4Q0YUQ0_9GAMM|nr:TetR/AcrR family transcriptional regulator [Veronia nyctiphanis]RXJ72761.1 hypothetical protein CS022_14090 [Veronia nyctiphanis]